MQVTTNLSASAWGAAVRASLAAETALQCAHSCLARQRDHGSCNAWHHTGTTCQLAVLSSLAEPGPGDQQQRLMLHAGAQLHTTCRGGEHCCQVQT